MERDKLHHSGAPFWDDLPATAAVSDSSAPATQNYRVRRLIKESILAADQFVPDAPYQIRASDLQDERVTAALARNGHPLRAISETLSTRSFTRLMMSYMGAALIASHIIIKSLGSRMADAQLLASS